MSDREIADLLRSDEEAAFRLLYRRYAGQLLAVAYRYTGDRDKAEDVLQEAMIKVCRHAETFSYRGDGSLYGWVKRRPHGAQFAQELPRGAYVSDG